MMRRFVILALVALWPALASAWDFDPAASAVRVTSVKNGDVAETHRFTDLTDAVAENGAALVAIGLGSVDTGIAIRDCPSSDNLGRLRGFRTGGSGSLVFEAMRFQFRGASAG